MIALSNSVNDIKPFLKWAGGKTQLLPAIEEKVKTWLAAKKKGVYVEPFVGSGAVLFFMLRKYGHFIQEAIINDVNEAVITCYLSIKHQPELLIQELASLEKQYFSYQQEADRQEFFLEQRRVFNSFPPDTLYRSALLIFLNKTCFNGLYRVNAKGLFNVPFGKYTKPTICNAPVILANSAALQKVKILNGDFYETLLFAGPDSFYYLDPPYKPISATSSFNAYAKEGFADADQIRLKTFCDELHQQGAYFIQSNSDTTNQNEANPYFQELYKSYQVSRVKAKRAINSKGTGRGEIFELLITNDSVLKP